MSDWDRESIAALRSAVYGVTDPSSRWCADLLSVATIGGGAFRRLKDVLSRWPGERERFYLMSADRRRGRARQWLAGQGFRPAAMAMTHH